MSAAGEKLYIVIPAYNERDNIYKVLDDWYPVVEKHSGGGESRLVVIDDGSKDDTYAIMQEYARTHPLFEPLTKPNGGHGATVLYGYHYALEHGADYIFQTDSDGQTLPEEFEPFWKQKESYDMVIGWRNKRQDGGKPCLCHQDTSSGHPCLFWSFCDRCQHPVPSDESIDTSEIYRPYPEGFQSFQCHSFCDLCKERL